MLYSQIERPLGTDTITAAIMPVNVMVSPILIGSPSFNASDHSLAALSKTDIISSSSDEEKTKSKVVRRLEFMTDTRPLQSDGDDSISFFTKRQKVRDLIGSDSEAEMFHHTFSSATLKAAVESYQSAFTSRHSITRSHTFQRSKPIAIMNPPSSTATTQTAITPSKSSRETSPANIRCKCNRSKCLKAYCMCFSFGKMCENCDCINCHNRGRKEHMKEYKKAQNLVNARNSNNSQPDIYNTPSIRYALSMPSNSGCNCRKSECLKKYCVCYKHGIKCTDTCACYICNNIAFSKNKTSKLLSSQTTKN